MVVELAAVALLAAGLVGAVAARTVAPDPPAALASATAAPGKTGRPICVRVGTRSEGWAWPNGRFIHWAKCKGVVPACDAAGKDGEGWYAQGSLIAKDPCPAAGDKGR
jgi:hypothetical protein